MVRRILAVEQGARRELARCAVQQRRIETLLELPDERLLERNESVSGWSAAEHLFHVTLANELSLKNVSALLDEKGHLIREREELDPRAVEILRTGRFPPGTQAPRFVQPPPKIDLPFTRELAGDVRSALGALLERDGFASAPNGIPHQALGVLSAPQWLRFVRMHTVHHLRIARTVLRRPQCRLH
jgi:hypothetical protein